ncbi:hypothetical protein, partial [Bacteroides ovatus]
QRVSSGCAGQRSDCHYAPACRILCF